MPSNNNNDFDLHDAEIPFVDFIERFGNTNIRNQLDKVLRDMGYGSMSTINYLSMRGVNYLRHGNQQVRTNRDNMGYVFFTRPILNLTYDNLSTTPTMVLLRNSETMSWQRWVRTTLDPWGQMGRNSSGQAGNATDISSSQRDITIADNNERGTPLVDPYNPFIVPLTNYIVSLSGWRDITMNTYDSKAGIHNEQWAMADGFYHKTETFELSAAFRNIEGDPITLLFQYWIEYMANCREGVQNPYPVFVEDREFDYNTRIYRFVMDQSRTYITKWASTIAFPVSTPHGNHYNFQVDKNFIDANGEIPITFKCIGAEYNNPTLFYEFNRLVAEYCPGLKVKYNDYNTKDNSLKVEGEGWRKLSREERNRGNMLAIPLINYRTRELEWWVRNEDWVTFIQYREADEHRKRQERSQADVVGEPYQVPTSNMPLHNRTGGDVPIGVAKPSNRNTQGRRNGNGFV